MRCSVRRHSRDRKVGPVKMSFPICDYSLALILFETGD
jgi:hypothetical protein